ncbi:hypothetical protein RRG08_008574 [Elysia crispata]|uniref:Uncharacterized protein n=1 Tax=Elysia crispata TaxID=231223 RepID=A0AAE0Y262_9GAST|nr:hypothetical protein RRG08_008574 [Elysia crispata]
MQEVSLRKLTYRSVDTPNNTAAELEYTLFSPYRNTCSTSGKTVHDTESVYLRRRSTVDAGSVAITYIGRRVMLVPWVAAVVFIDGKPLRPQAVYLVTPLLVAVAFAFGHRMNRTFKYIGEMARVFARISNLIYFPFSSLPSLIIVMVSDLHTPCVSLGITTTGFVTPTCLPPVICTESSCLSRRCRLDSWSVAVYFIGRRLMLLPWLAAVVLGEDKPVRPQALFLVIPMLLSVVFSFNRMNKTFKYIGEMARVFVRIAVRIYAYNKHQ